MQMTPTGTAGLLRERATIQTSTAAVSGVPGTVEIGDTICVVDHRRRFIITVLQPGRCAREMCKKAYGNMERSRRSADVV
jgi:hypothetical protein